MMTIKCLSAGLIATLVLTLSASAHENAVARPNVAMKGSVNVSSPVRWGHLNARIPALHTGEYVIPPHDASGGVCDHGDKAMVC
ncbi:hypothetical protein ACFFWD_32705 [Bradyrhizobium erythrophlei]|uniref:hypothetical protein n=1 Tax=Bradyrhizobium erythrophlei TaxID=1437360 RepID=UPI0035E4C7A6